MTPAINVIIPKTITAQRSGMTEKQTREMLEIFHDPGGAVEGQSSCGFHASKEIAPNHRPQGRDASFERPQMVTISDFLRVSDV